MKKIITLLLTSIVLLTGCSNSYNLERPELTQEEKTENIRIIEESLAKLNLEDITPEDKIEALRTIAVNNEYLGEYEKAIDYYEQTLALDPEDFATLNNLATFYEDNGQYDKAVFYIKQLYESHKDQWYVTKDAIRMLSKNGEFDEAQRIIDEYAVEYGTPENAESIADQKDYIKRMRNKAEGGE